MNAVLEVGTHRDHSDLVGTAGLPRQELVVIRRTGQEVDFKEHKMKEGDVFELS